MTVRDGDRTALDGRASGLTDALDHPVLGRRRRRTAAGLGIVAVFVALAALESAATALVDPTGALTPVRFLNALRWLTIAASLALVLTAVPYAAWNGGPLAAALLATAPTIGSGLARTPAVLTVDAVFGLLVASVAATLAVLVDARRATRGTDAEAVLLPDEDGLLVASAVTVVGGVAYWRLSVAPSPGTAAWIDGFGALLALPLAGLAVGWWTLFRTGRSE